ncbi:uncharacterized protein LOC121312995 isoform X1 [Polyodon spathula]|uniref:uncharacterized protein LOC121312995 isoform X1 n=1 Tax=Polyodon spathula TaxID=7913 RepID=UPI001B7DDD35|nr:uncharacterized protein LOC121312995 isoform X1 [Polyodon spathula]XP_041101002.1 uncharacterized protein LOC121312995 isoform X1 [Polyodon spathula]
MVLMAAGPGMWITVISNLTLCVSALYSAHQTYKLHRAPAGGLFLIACSGAAGSLLSMLPPSLRWAEFEPQQDLCWIGCLLGPALVSFEFLWLSEDSFTGNTLLGGAVLAAVLTNWLSDEGCVLITRCVQLSSLGCALTVCFFTANHSGLLGNLALNLAALIIPEVRGQKLQPAVLSDVTEVVLNCLMSLGSVVTERALRRYTQEL